MHKTTTRHHSDYDLQHDLEKIKAALREATEDVKGKAGEILSQSFDEVGEASAAIKEEASEYIGKKPFKTVGLALLTGAIIGYFLHK